MSEATPRGIAASKSLPFPTEGCGHSPEWWAAVEVWLSAQLDEAHARGLAEGRAAGHRDGFTYGIQQAAAHGLLLDYDQLTKPGT